jgi:3-oxoacyl-[acyl-carrier protein] reductase
MGKLNGKYAVVTGGGKGIGRAIVERFIIEEAAGVAILDYDVATAEATAAELTTDSCKVFAVKCDVSSPEQVETAFRAVCTQFPQVDILINNAGLTRDAMLHKMTLEQWDTVINANLKGIFLCMQQVMPGMRERQYGKIVNISSISAYGNIGQANYAASKAGILGLTATAAKELGPKNITVNAICPSAIYTDIVKTIPQKLLDAIPGNIPLRRWGQPSEVASVVLFLSCEGSSFVTGEMMQVGGGDRISF